MLHSVVKCLFVPHRLIEFVRPFFLVTGSWGFFSFLLRFLELLHVTRQPIIGLPLLDTKNLFCRTHHSLFHLFPVFEDVACLLYFDILRLHLEIISLVLVPQFFLDNICSSQRLSNIFCFLLPPLIKTLT